MYLQVKKDTKYLTKQSINQSIACTNAEIERGTGGGEKFFPLTKYIGTRGEDPVGKGKYFPSVQSKE